MMMTATTKINDNGQQQLKMMTIIATILSMAIITRSKNKEYNHDDNYIAMTRTTMTETITTIMTTRIPMSSITMIMSITTLNMTMITA